ncbi:hypothetical protein HPP92_002568 [Vanilla planifolia]|uniref:Uncharacterized protein n=1 Tax=Vanilla planifolia TaxID=51239 RepID=A0A835S5J7_VANPL|nr:hypothetical protein HPP92_002568 [Vanilla planifolia]
MGFTGSLQTLMRAVRSGKCDGVAPGEKLAHLVSSWALQFPPPELLIILQVPQGCIPVIAFAVLGFFRPVLLLQVASSAVITRLSPPHFPPQIPPLCDSSNSLIQ